MSAQLINWFSEAKSFLPWISFMAGLGGSLHCVGMCGGLVTASCSGSKDIVRYQLGRLLGYLFLGLLTGVAGSLLILDFSNDWFQLLPAISLGFLFIFWGLQNFRGRKAELPTPKFMGKLYTFLWKKMVMKNSGITKAFFIGLISIFLPCGLLYGIVISTVTLQHSFEALSTMFFFWLGTVPSMIIAPHIIQKFINPLRARLPKAHAISLVLIGVLTIGFRVGKFYHVKNEKMTSQTEERCH